jgi:hypothetical protein
LDREHWVVDAGNLSSYAGAGRGTLKVLLDVNHNLRPPSNMTSSLYYRSQTNVVLPSKATVLSYIADAVSFNLLG